MLLSRTAARALRPSLLGIPHPKHLPASLPALVLTCNRRPPSGHSGPTPAVHAFSNMTLTSSKIVGDVVDAVRPSRVKLDVKYKYDHVENGVTLSPAHTHAAPGVALAGADPGKLYALVMTDPDPPDPAAPALREWLHWAVTNIPGGEGASAEKGHTVVPYAGPSPPVGTHRYVFLAFEQPGEGPLAVEDPTKGEKMGRAHFNTRAFAKEHGLGDPVAACYFLSHK